MSDPEAPKPNTAETAPELESAVTNGVSTSDPSPDHDAFNVAKDKPRSGDLAPSKLDKETAVDAAMSKGARAETVKEERASRIQRQANMATNRRWFSETSPYLDRGPNQDERDDTASRIKDNAESNSESRDRIADQRKILEDLYDQNPDKFSGMSREQWLEVVAKYDKAVELKDQDRVRTLEEMKAIDKEVKNLEERLNGLKETEAEQRANLEQEKKELQQDILGPLRKELKIYEAIEQYEQADQITDQIEAKHQAIEKYIDQQAGKGRLGSTRERISACKQDIRTLQDKRSDLLERLR